MFSAAYLCICAYCMLQLGLLIVMENRRCYIKSGNERYFLLMLVIILFSFVADIMSAFNSIADWFLPLAVTGVNAEIILSTVLVPIFYRYTSMQISRLDPRLDKKLYILLWVLFLLCIVLLISNAYTGKIFYFDNRHIYHRGSLFFILMVISFIMMAIVEGFLISQKQKIESHYYRSLILFLVVPLIGWALQLLIYGLPFSLLGITFAAQILFMHIQNQNMDKDYLTGAFNRQTLDRYMQRKVDFSTTKTFSAILLDIDDFKSINDQYGHFEGDVALINAVCVLRNSVERKDFVARYGGDEFCIILEDDDIKSIEDTIQRIEKNLSDLNRNKKKLYKLSFSMGYATYSLSIGNAESFYKIIDRKMYEEKNVRKVQINAN